MNDSSFDWTRISDDPNNHEAKARARDLLRGLRRVHADRDLMDLVLAAAKGKRVLDIGVAAHSMRHFENPDWRHGKIAKEAKRCVGIDILAPMVDIINRHGFDVRLVDATSETDLGERFDLVFIGDVIEHVDNPVALLKFSRRHLAPGGRILAATPNALSRKFYRQLRREGVLVVNLDHLTWFTPSMALELARRAELDLVSYHLAKPIPQPARSLKQFLWKWLPPDYSFPDYLFEFSLSSETVT